MSKAWAKGSTTQWRKVRAAVLLRDNYRCQLRVPRVCEGTATQVHHLVGRDISGDDPKYLASSCAPCNQRVGNPATTQPKRVSSW